MICDETFLPLLLMRSVGEGNLLQNLEVNKDLIQRIRVFYLSSSYFVWFIRKNVRFSLVVLRNMLIFAPEFIPVTYRVTV